MNNRKEFGAKHNLEAEFIHELFSIIHKYSVKKQTEIVFEKTLTHNQPYADHSLWLL